MKKKTIGIIGPGRHFKKNIYPILNKSKFFKISGVLRKKKINFLNIKNFSYHDFFREKFDFIYISCPNKLHEKFILKSLNSHSHVICEKPFVIDDKKIKKIINLSIKNKKLIFEALMHVYHPVFSKLKAIIKNPKFGKLRYVVSNFKFPSLKLSNNRYKKNEGDGFYYDTAVYPLSLENYLFENDKIEKYNFFSKIIKKKIDLKGYIFINSKNFKRFYFWGEGQNYSNNLELVFEKCSIFLEQIYSKNDKKNLKIKIFFKNSFKTIKIKQINQFKLMFKTIQTNFYKYSFQNFHRKKIFNQIMLLKKFRK